MPDTFFRIEMLPARQGDALWIEYGKAGKKRRILIDGGPLTAYKAVEKRLNSLPEGDKRVELVVVTHVDTDHIEGIIRLFAQKRTKWPFEPEDIWFNGWRHLEEAIDLGGMEGDFLSALIRRRAFDVWNKAFEKKAIMVKPNEALPQITLADGMKLTILSPDPDKLKKMADAWRTTVEAKGFEPGDLDKAWDQLVETTKYHLDDGLLGGPKDFEEKLRKQLKIDDSEANGSSIAFLAEFEGKRCLFLGDAHWDLVCESIKKLIPAGEERLKVDAVKVSHHGSRHNISDKLMKLIDAKHYLVSTDGTQHGHPNKPAIDAILQWSKQPPTLWFNYRTKYNDSWAEAPKDGDRKYTACYPGGGSEVMVVEL